MQQLATHARDKSPRSASSISKSIICEVSSLYPRRGPNETAEALINAGCLTLGREPCADWVRRRDSTTTAGESSCRGGSPTRNLGRTSQLSMDDGRLARLAKSMGSCSGWVSASDGEIAPEYDQRMRI